jgi:Copper amine oxidase N-terminal domain
MKKYILVLLTVVMVSAMLTVSAEASDVKIKYNGEYINPSPAAFIENGRVYLPLRALSELLGLAIDYDNNTGNIYVSTFMDHMRLNAKNTNIKIVSAVDSEFMTVTTAGFSYDHILIRESRSFVAVRVLGAIGIETQWINGEVELYNEFRDTPSGKYEMSTIDGWMSSTVANRAYAIDSTPVELSDFDNFIIGRVRMDMEKASVNEPQYTPAPTAPQEDAISSEDMMKTLNGLNSIFNGYANGYDSEDDIQAISEGTNVTYQLMFDGTVASVIDDTYVMVKWNFRSDIGEYISDKQLKAMKQWDGIYDGGTTKMKIADLSY